MKHNKERRQIQMSVLLERILSRGNMYMALEKVKANKGAGGIDGIEID